MNEKVTRPGDARVGQSVAATPPRPATGRPSTSSTRKIRDGIKVRLRAPDHCENWLAQEWLQTMRSVWSAAMLSEAWDLARLGQVASPRLDNHIAVGSVQGSGGQLCSTRLRVDHIAPDAVPGLVQRMALSAALVARFISNELPVREQLEDLFSSSNLSIAVPPASLLSRCTCSPAAENVVCAHGAAIAYHVLDWLNRDPLLWMELRGVDRGALLDQLRRARALQTAGQTSGHADALPTHLQSPPPPIESHMEDFWRCGPSWAHLREGEPTDYAPRALLRRLGPSPLGGRFPMVGLLENIYAAMSEHARALREASLALKPDAETDQSNDR
jgi:uncharacterized Zn finger protein